MRLSVGLTGSKEQRWAQLEAAYRYVAAVPAGALPTHKAVQVCVQMCSCAVYA